MRDGMTAQEGKGCVIKVIIIKGLRDFCDFYLQAEVQTTDSLMCIGSFRVLKLGKKPHVFFYFFLTKSYLSFLFLNAISYHMK